MKRVEPKVSFIEELGKPFDIVNEDEFSEKIKKISPFGKIPVITDHENGQSLFESGAILIYLGEKYNKFYDLKDRYIINQWLMAQMGIIGPMIGQHHQFHHYNPGKSEFGEERYFKITKKIVFNIFVWKNNKGWYKKMN